MYPNRQIFRHTLWATVAFLRRVGGVDQHYFDSGLDSLVVEQVLEQSGHKLWAIATNLPIVAGVVIYAAATLLYMYVISKFKYGTSYTMIVSFSLIGATVMSTLFFDERMLRVNFVGIAVVMVGVFLVLQK